MEDTVFTSTLFWSAQQQVVGPGGDSGPQCLYIAPQMYRQICYPQQAQHAMQRFRW